MHIQCACSLVVLGLSVPLLAGAQSAPQDGGDFSSSSQAKKLPTDVILVKGAWPSASDFANPLPEGGKIANGAYKNQYFSLRYPLTPDWREKYSGPPPSDTGYYVLAQIRSAGQTQGEQQGKYLDRCPRYVLHACPGWERAGADQLQQGRFEHGL